MKIVSINSVPYGSTGHIMKDITHYANLTGNMAQCYCRKWKDNKAEAIAIPFGSYLENAVHVVLSQITGLNGCFSLLGTYKLLKEITKINPDIIHLHNLHFWYINLPMLFHYIKKHNIRTVWTLHDCWSFTGQCPHFTMVKCNKWKTGCYDCEQYRLYPQAYVDQTKLMYRLKKKWFTGIENMTIVTPSQWLADLVKQSFLSDYPVKVINNGIDLNVFKPTESDFRETHGITPKSGGGGESSLRSSDWME